MNDGLNLVNLPANLAFREVKVNPWADTFKVPSYVIRVDIEGNNGGAGTHGWQVRYRKKTKLFSDGIVGLGRSPKDSLREAILHLDSIYKGRSPKIKEIPAANKINEIKDVGIRLVKRIRKTRKVIEINIEVSPPRKGDSAKRFYVGTENTVTPQKIESKLFEAKEFRRKLVDQYREEIAQRH